MNYYALFLDGTSYIEKCLSLIRFVCNPSSSSLPHITLRLFRMDASRIDEFTKREFSYLNIIEPGTFNILEKAPPYVVYIRCESEELEGIEYKPDFPLSRLHITLYEGDNLEFANKLYKLLKKRNYKWHFVLPFNEPKKLTKKVIGVKYKNKYDFNNTFIEILGDSYYEFLDNMYDDSYKLEIIEKILRRLNAYCNSKKNRIKRIASFYRKDINENPLSFIDASKNSEDYFNQHLTDGDFIVKKPVQDAIYVTPPEYARDMAECALAAFLDDSKKIHFGDSAIGTGTLFLALKHLVDEINGKYNRKYDIQSAIGIDIEKKMAKEAFVRCNKRGLEVIYGDAISPELNLKPSRNLMLVNPPFNRHNDIPKSYKEKVHQLAKEQTGISVAGNAGLYVYHLLIMDKWLCDGGVAVWLLPSVFMQAKYGEAIRKYLLYNVELLKMHIYDDSLIQFENAQISTTIIVFRKNSVVKNNSINISFGESLKSPNFSAVVEKKHLINNFNNWRGLFTDFQNSINIRKGIRFEELFDIKRGIATGANSFFVMKREEALRIGIPSEALKPLIPKARYLKSLIIESDEMGFPRVNPQQVLIDCDYEESFIYDKFPNFYNYLQHGKERKNNEKAVIERTLVKSRKPWYKQEQREIPTYLLTYMGRNKSDLPPLYFVLNKSNAVALNTYLLLYPKTWLRELLEEREELYEELLVSLNKSAEETVSNQTRVYSGGLKKIEPNGLRELVLIDLPKEIINRYSIGM